MGGAPKRKVVPHREQRREWPARLAGTEAETWHLGQVTRTLSVTPLLPCAGTRPLCARESDSAFRQDYRHVRPRANAFAITLVTMDVDLWRIPAPDGKIYLSGAKEADVYDDKSSLFADVMEERMCEEIGGRRQLEELASSVEWNLDLREAAGRCGSHGGGNCRKPVPDEPPSARANHHDRQLATGQILLVGDVAVCRQEHVGTGGFRSVQQLAVS